MVAGWERVVGVDDDGDGDGMSPGAVTGLELGLVALACVFTALGWLWLWTVVRRLTIAVVRAGDGSDDDHREWVGEPAGAVPSPVSDPVVVSRRALAALYDFYEACQTLLVVDDPVRFERHVDHIIRALHPTQTPEFRELVRRESVCEWCLGPNVVWIAPSPLWNAVVRDDGSINGGEEAAFLCPRCFAVRAEERGIACDWRLTAQRVAVPLETVTPSGRRWNDVTWRFDDPEPRPAVGEARRYAVNGAEIGGVPS